MTASCGRFTEDSPTPEQTHLGRTVIQRKDGPGWDSNPGSSLLSRNLQNLQIKSYNENRFEAENVALVV